MTSRWIEKRTKGELERLLSCGDFSEAQSATLARVNRHCMRHQFSVQTRLNYGRQALRLARFIRKPFEQATKEDLEAYLDSISHKSPHTVAGAKRFLKAFYRILLPSESGGHPDLVAWIPLRMPKGRTLPKDLLTKEEIRRLAEAAVLTRDRAIVMVLYDSAARVSELLSMRVGDVEFDRYGARATLDGKTGARKVRLLQSVADLQAWLDLHPFRDEPEKPLWLSWGSQNRLGPLTQDGVAWMLRCAAQRVGIRKRVYAHLFRHSRLTELAKQLSESELKVFAGWTADSSMAKVYIHLSGDDVDRKMLEKAGLLDNGNQEKPDPLATKECPRCREKNSPATIFCAKCTLPLDGEERAKLASEQEILQSRLPALLRLLEDPDVKALLTARTQPIIDMPREPLIRSQNHLTGPKGAAENRPDSRRASQ